MQSEQSAKFTQFSRINGENARICKTGTASGRQLGRPAPPLGILPSTAVLNPTGIPGSYGVQDAGINLHHR